MAEEEVVVVVNEEHNAPTQAVGPKIVRFRVPEPISHELRLLRNFTLGTDAPDQTFYLEEEIVNDTFINEVIRSKLTEPKTTTPSTVNQTSIVDSMARQYWNEYDAKKLLLHKYMDTTFPQFDKLIRKWGILSRARWIRKLKEQYILLEKGDELKTGTSHQIPPSSPRYLWRDMGDVARTERRSNNHKDTVRILELENHINTSRMNSNHPLTCQCGPHEYLSCLHQRFQQLPKNKKDKGFRDIPSDWKPYFLLTAISEYEQDQGGDEDGDGLEASMVGDSYWTIPEKRRFFVGLDRYGRHRVHDIAKRVGPTKTTQEVIVYLNILDQLAKVNPNEDAHDADLSAREMSSMFIIQEEQMASRLVQHLETESYKKHRELVLSQQYENVQELFELWNMSSLTRLFVGTDDMTILISAIVQYHQLVRNFVQDIITTLYTEITNEKDKMVTKKRMNRVIAKRRQTWKSLHNERPDARLKNMDVMGVIDRKRLFHETFSRNKSASFLAKKRQNRWVVKNLKLNDGSKSPRMDLSQDEGEEEDGENQESENNIIEESQLEKDGLQDGEKELEECTGDDLNIEEDNIPTEEEDYVDSDSDTDFCDESDDGLNETDKLDGEFYYALDHDSEDELSQRLGHYEAQFNGEQLDSSSDDDDDDESQNKLLDKDYEEKLSKQLGFIVSD
ncbi:hypothetical protein K501DRAFT_336074 [Backusella circina FSU 941]|nr:hypothetical protein K501DRAFT_336074 [Backusella circina FSU 941]